MDGFSIITYKDKQIYYTDYTNVGDSKEKIIQLFNYALAQSLSQPPKSVLSLTNFSNLNVDNVDMDLINFYRSNVVEIANYKKIAAIGLTGMVYMAYNIFINFVKDYSINMQAFNSELEAKEWLVSD
jgi:hypothetical protein